MNVVGKDDAERVKVAVSVDAGDSPGVVVEITNGGSLPIRDVVLSEVGHLEHPEWTWRRAPDVRENPSMWWQIAPGQTVRCRVEFGESGEDARVVSASGFRVRAFWCDKAGNWWVITADRLGASDLPAPSESRAEPPPSDLPRLTSEEDAEMRQLTWFASFSQLSEESQARLASLKARDRRTAVRDARPDPVSRHADLSATRVEPAAPLTGRCAHCAFEVKGPALACPACGQPLIAYRAHG